MSKEIHIENRFIIIVVVMLAAVALTSVIFPNANRTLFILAASFVELIVLFTTFKKISLSPLLIIFFINSLLMMSVGWIMGIDMNYLDYINQIIKLIMVALLYLAVKPCNVKKENLIKFAQYMVWLVWIACVYNLIANRSMINTNMLYMNAYDMSFKSFFYNRNQFGMFLVVGLFYVQVYFRKTTWVKVITNIMIAFNIIITMSRGSMISAIVFFLLYDLFSKSITLKKIFSRFIFVLVSIVIVLLLFKIRGLAGFVENNLVRTENGLTGRDSIWLLGLRIAWQNNILNGTGLFTGVDIAHMNGMTQDQFHSLYIDSVVEGGIIGLVCVLYIYINVLKKCRMKIKEKSLRAACVAMMISVLVMGANESVSFFSIGWVDTFFTISCISYPLLMANCFIVDEQKKCRS